jgi:DNA-binding SARP family transcriptional activator
MSEMQPARITVIGPFKAVLASGEPATFRTRRAAEVVARLLLQSSRRMTRGDLAASIWPDFPASDALRNLRPALTYARTSLGSDSILKDDDFLVLSPAIESDWSDIRRLEVAARLAESPADRLAHLVSLESRLRGDLLEGWDGEWLEPFREVHRRRQAKALQGISEEFAADARWDAAIEYARRWAELEPLSDEAVGRYIRLLAETGQTALARREFEHLSQRLKSQLGLTPTQALRTLVRRLDAVGSTAQEIRPITSRQHEFFAHLVNVLLEQEPERLLAIFSTSALNWTVMLHDSEIRPLLERVVHATTGASPDRRGVMKRLLQLESQHQRVKGLNSLAQELRDCVDTDDLDALVAHSHLAEAAQLAGKYEQAKFHSDEAERVAKVHQHQYFAAVLSANRSGFEVDWGNTDTAIPMLKGTLEDLSLSDTQHGRFSQVVARQMLLWALVVAGEYESAVEYATEWRTMNEYGGFSHVETGGAAIYGLALAATGRNGGRAQCLVCVDKVLARRNVVSMQVTIDAVIPALALLGDVLGALETRRRAIAARHAAGIAVHPGTRRLWDRHLPQDSRKGETGSLPSLLSYVYDRLSVLKGS